MTDYSGIMSAKEMTAFLIFALVIAVTQDGATGQLVETYEKLDQIAEEGKNRAVTIIDGPKYVTPPQTPAPANTTLKPPSKPPNPPYLPEKHGKPYAEIPRLYYAPVQVPPMRKPYAKPMKVQHTVYKYQKVVPLHPHRHHYHKQQQPLVFAASTGKPSVAKSPKFSLPVETINGIRADFVRPPHGFNTTTTTSSTTTPSTTTARYLRTKRIWPKHILEKMKAVNASLNGTIGNKTEDLHASHSFQRYVYLNRTSTTVAPSTGSTTRAPYRRVTRSPKRSTTTAAPENASLFPPNDWVPIIPSHYPVKTKVRKFKQTPIYRRSDVLFYEPKEASMNVKRMLYLHSYGLLPVASSQSPSKVKASHSSDDLGLESPGRKYNNRGKRPLNLNSLSGYRRKPALAQSVVADYETEESQAPQIVTKIKHHHHHHHHRYIKTVEKPVKVEVSKPVPVPVPMPVPVKVEKKVPYPVQVKVPHPVPVKVIQKEYVPKPYPVYQQVPVYQKVEVKVPHPVPVPVEKQVPYPVHVQVPVDRPVPVPVPYEKRVPYPVPVRVLVPQPYPVETKVPVPVKEPVEVVRHVPVRVPYPKPFAVKVPVPVPYEKRVPYPVEVERPVPVPYRVPEKVEVEKKVPVFLPKPYPVEKRVPYPVKVPFPVKVPVRVPVGIPIIVRPSPSSENVASGDVGANEGGSGFSYSIGNPVTHEPHSSVTFNSDLHNSIEEIGKVLGFTSSPQREGDTVTVHGRPGFSGFQSRSDDLIYDDETTTSHPVTTTTSIETTTTSSEPTTTSSEPTTTSAKPTTTSSKTTTNSSKTTTASTKTTGTRSKTTISQSRTTTGEHFEVIGLQNSGEEIAHKPR